MVIPVRINHQSQEEEGDNISESVQQRKMWKCKLNEVTSAVCKQANAKERKIEVKM